MSGVAEKCPDCGSQDKAKRLCVKRSSDTPLNHVGHDHSAYDECQECTHKWHTAPAETAEQRLADRLGLTLHGDGVLGLKTGQFQPARGGWLKINALWDHAVRLEREHRVMREALEKISAKTCCCMSSDPDWHYETCWKFFAESALSQIGKP